MKNQNSDLTLIPGDWLEIVTELRPHSVDLVLSDLPFGVTQHQWDCVIPFPRLWETFERVCKPEANIVLFGVHPFAANLINSKPAWFRYDLIWVKNKATGFLNANRRPLARHEAVLVFRRTGSGVYHPQKTDGNPPMHAVRSRKAFIQATYGAHCKHGTQGGTTKRFPTSVLAFPRVNNDAPTRVHPHQKPLALLEYLIRTYSNPRDTVLDPTMGSGSTGIACVNAGRHFIGVEKDEDYFDAAETWLLATSCPSFPGWRPYDNPSLVNATEERVENK